MDPKLDVVSDTKTSEPTDDDIDTFEVDMAIADVPADKPQSVKIDIAQVPTLIHPWDHPSSFVRLFYQLTNVWQFPLLIKGAKKPLEPGEIWNLPRFDTLEHALNEFDSIEAKLTSVGTNGNNETNSKSRSGSKKASEVSLSKILWHQARGLTFSAIFAMLISSIPSLLMPYFIKYLSLFYENKNNNYDNIWYGISICIIWFLSSMIRLLLDNYVWICMGRVYVRTNMETKALIYRKSICMSLYSRNQSNTGQTVNLMSQDSQKVASIMAYGLVILSYFTVTLTCLGLLFVETGIAAIPGFLVLIFTMPVQGKLGQKMGRTRRKMMEAADTRVKFINEVLQGIRVVKLYAWEHALLNRVAFLRKEELKRLLLKVKYWACLDTFNYSSPPIVLIVILGTYVLVGNELSVSKAFTVIALINVLRASIGLVAGGAFIIIEGMVSVGRINKFLSLRQLKPIDVSKDDKHPICIKNGTFVWVPFDAGNDSNTKDNGKNSNEQVKLQIVKSTEEQLDSPKDERDYNENEDTEDEKKELLPQGPTLMNITFEVDKGSLVGIVGTVGSGKSSLLSCILGEMDCLDGTVEVNGNIAYTAQRPFILNATVRENILFGKEFDSVKYKRCIKAAAMLHDLTLLPNKDLTEIGERGINLSGGQKSRISFARAMYRHDSCDIFMFDDPLSAVDMEVGNTLFTKGILGIIKDKTRIIVMNSHLHLLKEMDQIIIMQNGKIAAMGTFEQLSNDENNHKLLESAIQKQQQQQQQNDIEKKQHKESIGDINDDAFSKQQSQSRQSSDDLIKGQSDGNGSGDGDKNKNIKGKLIEEEDRDRGSVNIAVYATYLSNAVGTFDYSIPHKTGPNTFNSENWLANTKCQGWLCLIAVIICMIILHGLILLSDLWLLFWAEEDTQNRFKNDTNWFWLGIWSAFIFSLAFFSFITIYGFAIVAAHAGQNLHMRALYAVLRSPIKYFDKTPVGRILNRFGKDTEQMDDAFPQSLIKLMSSFLTFIGSVVIVSYAVPYMLILFIIVGYVFYLIQKFYRASSRELQRMESISKSPIFALFSETLTGLDTIRAYQMQDYFMQKNASFITENSKLLYMKYWSGRWLSTNLAFTSKVTLICVALSGVFLRDYVDYGLLTLAVTYATNFGRVFDWLINTLVGLENASTSVQRLLHYQTNEPEADELTKDINPQLAKQLIDTKWPDKGRVEFNNLRMRYRKDLDYVLNGINAIIDPGMKVGICGRTGAGKSSLLVALFRLVEAERDVYDDAGHDEPQEENTEDTGSNGIGNGKGTGSIIIDTIDIQSVGLQDLRKNMSIIPQDPVLFSGSVRFNLDPFDQIKDDNLIWDVLKKVHLFQLFDEKKEKLLFEITEQGSNLSQGQRQLICIGRALLRKSKILVLDEATASVDAATDKLIQETIRENFVQQTVLTIAHRLDTILDSDKIMVLSDGKIIEFDTPQTLLNDKNSMFAAMVKSGKKH